MTSARAGFHPPSPLRSPAVWLAAVMLAAAVVPAASDAHVGSGHRHDADRDGLSNRFERHRSHTNPHRRDTDRDGLSDRYEVRRSHTNPRRRDTDRDGVSDGVEVRRGRLRRAREGAAATAPSGGGTTRPAPGGGSSAATPDGGAAAPTPDGGAAAPTPEVPTQLPSPPLPQAPTTPPRDTNCMPDPSACGYPDVENTGTLEGVARQSVRGIVSLDTPGQVYENKTVTGSIIVTAPNVTIRNVKLIDTDENYGIRAFGWNSGVDNLVVEDSEIDMNGNLGTKGIAFDEYTLRRVFMHNGSDCAHFGDNVVIEDSLCVVGPDKDGDAWPDSRSFCSGPDHFDGFQTNGGSNLVIRHNTIRNPCGQTSDIAIFDDSGPTTNTTVDGNLLAGGGYSVYCPADHGFVASMRVTGNRFARTWFSRSGQWGPTATCEYAGTVSGNVWDDTGAAVDG